MTNRPDGIYELVPGRHWIVLSKGERNDFKAPAYDLAFLVCSYRGRLEYRGPWDPDWKGEHNDETLLTLLKSLPGEWKIEGSRATGTNGITITMTGGGWRFLVDWGRGRGPQIYFSPGAIIADYRRKFTP